MAVVRPLYQPPKALVTVFNPSLNPSPQLLQKLVTLLALLVERVHVVVVGRLPPALALPRRQLMSLTPRWPTTLRKRQLLVRLTLVLSRPVMLQWMMKSCKLP